MANNKIKVVDGVYPVNVYSSTYKDGTDITLADDLEINKWKSKKWLLIGDSITWQDGKDYSDGSGLSKGYQSYVAERLGLILTNTASSGQSAGGYWSSNSTKDYSGYDVVTIMLGTNLFESGGVGIVSASNYDTNTFCGAYQSIIERILSTNPTCFLVLITPPPYFVNNNKLQVVEKIDEIATMYSLPKCDFYRNSGVNKINYTNYYRDNVHPNNLGYERLGTYLTKFIKQF